MTKDEVLSSDNAENSWRANTQLATGGFLIGDSDLRGPLGHVNEEISSYYEVTLNPNIQKSEVRWDRAAAAYNRMGLTVLVEVPCLVWSPRRIRKAGRAAE